MPWRTVMLFSAPSPGCCPFGGATYGGAVAVVSQKWLPLPSSDDLRVCRYCVVDWIGMATFGGRIQDATWVETVEKVVAASGGRAPDGVRHEVKKLDAEELDRETRRIDELVVERKREANADAVRGASPDEAPEPGNRARKDGDVSRPSESVA